MPRRGEWYDEERAPARRRWWVAGALLVVVVALLAVAAHVLADANSAAGGPAAAVARYCQALEARDYSSAYASFAPDGRGGLTRDQYTAEAQLRDKVDGTVTRCAATDPAGAGGLGRGLGIVFGAGTETMDLTIVRATLGSRTGALTLERATGWVLTPRSSATVVVWFIRAQDPALTGTDLAPIEAAVSFCGDLITGNYTAAYAALSADQQKIAKDETTFSEMARPPREIHYTSCVPVYSGYHITGTVTAAVAIALGTTITLPAWTANETDTFTLKLVHEGGAWKVDGIIPPGPGITV
jgi:hypothetical protein